MKHLWAFCEMEPALYKFIIIIIIIIITSIGC